MAVGEGRTSKGRRGRPGYGEYAERSRRGRKIPEKKWTRKVAVRIWKYKKEGQDRQKQKGVISCDVRVNGKEAG